MDKTGKKIQRFVAGDVMKAKISWSKPGVKNVGVAVFRQSGEYIFGINTYLDNHPIVDENTRSLSFMATLNMSEGEYFIKADTYGENDGYRIDFNDEGSTFVVNRNKDDIRWGGLTKLEYGWEE